MIINNIEQKVSMGDSEVSTMKRMMSLLKEGLPNAVSGINFCVKKLDFELSGSFSEEQLPGVTSSVLFYNIFEIL